MDSLIDDLKNIINSLEYGDITKNDLVSKLEQAISEIEEINGTF